MIPQSLISKTLHAFDIMATIKVMTTEFLGPPGSKVRHGVPTELRSVLENMTNPLLLFESCMPCEVSVSSNCCEIKQSDGRSLLERNRQRTSNHRAPDTTRVQTVGTDVLA